MTIEELAKRPNAYPPLQHPYVIAEVGVNHEGDMETAKRLIELAADAGAQAVKFQTYRAETLASKESPAYWDTTKEPTSSQFELFSKYDTFWREDFKALKRHCDAQGVEFLSTPFDAESVELLEPLMPAYKISSSDLTNIPFVELICKKGKPVLLSTGAATMAEIQEAVDVVARHGNPLVLMHCILNYPTNDADANLGMLADIRRRFPEVVLGYSDHTLPNSEMDVLTTAWMLGATVLEKHFTHDKSLPGNDHYHAMDGDDLRTFWARVGRREELVGRFAKRPLESEALSRRNARRSLVSASDLQPGVKVTSRDLTWKRPGTGISPRNFNKVVGLTPRKAIPADTVLQWNMFD